MSKGRLEAFSDGVIAIIITIMVLELKAPQEGTWRALTPLLPDFLSYVLSFIFIGIYLLIALLFPKGVNQSARTMETPSAYARSRNQRWLSRSG